MRQTTLKIESPAINPQSFMEEYYGAKDANVNPPIKINHLPPNTKSLAIEISNPNAPIRPWVHWLVWNIPVLGSSVKIKTDSSPGSTTWNDFGQMGYTGPFFYDYGYHFSIKVFALDTFLPDTCGSPIHQVMKSIYNTQIAGNELMWFFKPINAPKIHTINSILGNFKS